MSRYIQTLLSCCLAFCAISCTSSSGAESDTSPDSPGSADVSYTMSPVSDIPYPATSSVARPSATVATPGLKVLNWAGFTGASSYSFDDCQPSHKEYWEDLKATGIRMTFYINIPASWNDYSTMWTEAVSLGFEIGNHTKSHKLVSDVTTEADRKAEIEECTAWIKAHTGQSGVWSMAYPLGDTTWKNYFNSSILLARTVYSGSIAPLSSSTDALLLPVYPVSAGDTASSHFNPQLASAASNGKWVLFMYHSILPSAQNWYAGVQMSEISSSVTYGLSKGLWMDSVINVGAYWYAQRLFTALSPATSGTAKVWTWTLPSCFPPGKYLRVTVDGGTLSQGGTELAWDTHGFYEVALDAGELTWKQN